MGQCQLCDSHINGRLRDCSGEAVPAGDTFRGKFPAPGAEIRPLKKAGRCWGGSWSVCRQRLRPLWTQVTGIPWGWGDLSFLSGAFENIGDVVAVDGHSQKCGCGHCFLLLGDFII